ELGIEANFSELQSIYGFDGETDVSHMQSVVTQTADILYPQLGDPKPTVIPVGPDQDPHVRLTRDLAARVRYFGVTEAYASFETDAAERALLAEAFETLAARHPDQTIRCGDAATYLEGERDSGATDVEATTLDDLITMLNEAGGEPLRPRVRFLERNATGAAFERLVESIEGETRVYDEHVDAFDLDHQEAEELARQVEVETGGYGFVPPSATYNRFMTGLTGGKMSSSVPESHISLLDDPGTGYDKVKAATTGGRETAEAQRELGGRAEECPVYELYAYLLAGEDDEFAREVYEECVGGDRLCGDCKEQAAVLMEGYLEDHQEKRDMWAEKLAELDYDVDSGRR
ncbi:MAG: tryptophan--tRNA ligase, partial [Haloarculaceae archaeon]